jgi:biopolymer transport protein ExbD
MAFSNLQSGGGRRSRGMPAMAEINVTPFVDIALVLLIIFMITAHVMDSGIEINVPKTQTVASSSKDQPVVAIDKAGEIFLGNNPTNINLLASQIRSRYAGQTGVFVRADAEVPFDIVAQVMSVLGTAKLSVSVVTKADHDTGRRR